MKVVNWNNSFSESEIKGIKCWARDQQSCNKAWQHCGLTARFFSAAVQEMSSIKGLQKLCSERWKSSCGSCWITVIKSRSLTNGNDTLQSVCSSRINPQENFDFSVIFYNNIWIHVLSNHILYLKIKLKQKTQLCVTEPTAKQGRLRLPLLQKYSYVYHVSERNICVVSL